METSPATTRHHVSEMPPLLPLTYPYPPDLPSDALSVAIAGTATRLQAAAARAGMPELLLLPKCLVREAGAETSYTMLARRVGCVWNDASTICVEAPSLVEAEGKLLVELAAQAEARQEQANDNDPAHRGRTYSEMFTRLAAA